MPCGKINARRSEADEAKTGRRGKNALRWPHTRSRREANRPRRDGTGTGRGVGVGVWIPHLPPRIAPQRGAQPAKPPASPPRAVGRETQAGLGPGSCFKAQGWGRVRGEGEEKF